MSPRVWSAIPRSTALSGSVVRPFSCAHPARSGPRLEKAPETAAGVATVVAPGKVGRPGWRQAAVALKGRVAVAGLEAVEGELDLTLRHVGLVHPGDAL